MSDTHRNPEDESMSTIHRDLAAFRKMTEQDVPELSHVARAVRNLPSQSEERALMKLFRNHPFMAPAVMTLAVLFLVMFLPVSFDRTVGQDVSLKLSGVALDQARVKALATEMKSQLGAEHVEVRTEENTGTPSFEFRAFVASKSDRQAHYVLDAFHRTLTEQGLLVTTSLTPRVERVSGNVAAYAAENVIHINTQGKSASQIESEIRSAMIAAGMDNVQVSVTDRPEGGREVRIEAERETTQPGQEIAEPQVVLEGEGQATDPDAQRVKVRKLKDEAGAISLVVDVQDKNHSATATVQNPDSMSESAVASEIRSQLFAAGIDADVTFTNGKIEVRPR
ncbi:MAG TPA: hypothetical protein VFR10_04525 [bacterium]|nr:hypothetical protein [bacterium]